MKQTKKSSMKCMMIAMALGVIPGFTIQALARPLKVFILAGQSNMEGPAHIRTIEGIADDPATASMHKEMAQTGNRLFAKTHGFRI